MQVVNVTPRYAKLKGNDKREVSLEVSDGLFFESKSQPDPYARTATPDRSHCAAVATPSIQRSCQELQSRGVFKDFVIGHRLGKH